LVRHALGRARRRRTLIDQLAAGDDLDALSSDLTALDADLPPPPAPPSDDGVKARAALDAAKAKLAPRDALVLALLFEDAGSMDDVAEALAMPMEDVAAARERVLEAAGGEGALRGLGDRADATKIETPHADEPVLALLRHGDHGDDLADAMAHVARCAECRARLVVGAVEGRSVVVVAIEAP